MCELFLSLFYIVIIMFVIPYLAKTIYDKFTFGQRNVVPTDNDTIDAEIQMSEISKKRTVSSEVIETESSEVQITQQLSENSVIVTNSKSEDVSLQDLIEAELNSRLSNNIIDRTEENSLCMSSNNIAHNDENGIEENGQEEEEEVTSNDLEKQYNENIVTNNTEIITRDDYNDVGEDEMLRLDVKQATVSFIESEKEHSTLTSHENEISECNSPTKSESDPIVRINEENSVFKEEEIVVKTIEKPSSIKDKLMLGNDDQMALLFSQTITSPAFTPTDENFDILQALKREENSIDEFIKNENMCRVVAAVEEKIKSFDDEKPLSNNDISNGEISPEDEREISQDSDFSESTRVKSTIKVQDSIQIIEQEIKNCDFICVSSSNDDDDEQIVVSKDTILVEKITTPVDDDNRDDSTTTTIELGEDYHQSSDGVSVTNNVDEVDDVPCNNIVAENHDEIQESTKLLNQCANNTNSTKLVLDLINTTTTIQTTVSETIENNSSTNNVDNKTHLKKKKSKKSKKDNEKENISVNENNTNNIKDQLYIEDDLSQVNVRNLKKTYCDQSINGSISVRKSEPIISTGISIKQLCRSFGDLTSLPDDNNSSSMQNSMESSESSPDSRAKSLIDLRRLDSEPLYRGVSVKALKSSFSKFDALSKKTMLHVRSSDAGKAQEKFNGSAALIEQNCKACSKQVFQMEQMKAEKAIWHKNCFRCKECNKQLNVDTYQSHEGTLYCKPHFKALFAPKVVEETQPMKPRKHELIIRESQPIELPPDVVRASDKPDLGLEELQSLNVKERFQVFEHANDQENQHTIERTSPSVKRSSSILSKLARFQAKGMDIGVSDDALNGVPIEPSSDESEQSDEDLGEDADLIRAKRKTAQKEEPIVFDKLDDLKSRWESGSQMTKDERREECKQEIQSIRSRLFMGKQGKMKEMYQQAVMDSESGANVKKLIPATEISDTAKSIKERFEKGEALVKDEETHKVNSKEEDMSIFEAGISKKSRSIFKELDATSGKPLKLVPLTPVKSQSDVKKAYQTRQISEDVVRSSDSVDDIQIETADISNKFKFFETYKAPETERKQFRITPPRDGVVKENSPDREIYHDPDVVRSEETIEDPTVAAKTHTATKMLSIFRQLEEKNASETVPTGPKPLKRFTPPPEPTRQESESEEEGVTSSEEEESDIEQTASDVIRAVDKPTDEFLVQAQNAARAKQLRAKFEKWEENELRRELKENNSSSISLAEEHSEETIESAKTLRARFESMQETTTTQKIETKPRVKVHRFVELQVNNAELCEGCGKRVYPLEKIECNTKAYHKQCFKCLQCKTVLRMDSYTLNQGMLYCIPHFKQLFIAKGNYETGFGLDQHKSKWENHQQQQSAGHVTPAH